ncbi:tape measure protein [Mycobacterium phage Cepens]|nr:tape measure protein [Mycobacterium phage Cepens]
MTTPVGSIRIDLTIDGSDDLWADVAQAIAPVMAGLEQLNRRIDAVERSYGQTGREAERSSRVQSAALERVSIAAERVADRYERVGRAATQMAAVSATAINTVTSAWERQTAAINANTAARLANSRAPIGGGPGGGLPPGGGGGGGRGGNQYGGRRGRGMLITGALNLGALAADALPATGAALTNILGSVQQLAQAGLALPAIYGGVAASIGTVVVGFQGLGDAIKEANEAQQSGDWTKFNDVTKDMASNAVGVAKAVSELTKPGGALKNLQKQVAQPMFDGIDKSITHLVDRSLPTLNRRLPQIGTSWNKTFKELGAVGGSDSTQGFLDQVLGNTADAQERANRAIEPFVHAFGQLSATGSQFLPRLADALADVMERFDAFITRNAENGNLFRWIDEGLNGFRALGNTLLNIGKILTGLTKANGELQGSLSGDGGLLGGLERVTEKWATFVNSDVGQSKLIAFFKDAKGDMAEWGELLKSIGSLAADVIAGFQDWGAILRPVLQSILDLLDLIPGGVEAVVVAFLAWRTITAVTALNTALTGVSTTLTALPGLAGRAGTAVGRLFSARGLAGGALATAGAIGTSSDSGLGQLAGALGMVGGGALAGSAFGPAGTAIGATVGGVLAGVTYFLGQAGRAAEEAAAQQASYAAALERTNQAALVNQNASKQLSDALLESGGQLDQASLSALEDQIGNIPEALGLGDQEQVDAFAGALVSLRLSEQQLANQVVGDQGVFDALTTNLAKQGPAGEQVAESLRRIRENYGLAAQAGATAQPVLDRLTATMNAAPGDYDQVAANLKTVFDALPQGKVLDLSTEGVQPALDLLTAAGAQIDIINNKPIVANADSESFIAIQNAFKAVGVEIDVLNDKSIRVNIDQQALDTAVGTLTSSFDKFKTLYVSPVVTGPPGVNNQAADPFQLPRPGGASGGLVSIIRGYRGGGVLPGYSPGVDNLLGRAGGRTFGLSGGEGIVIPEAMRALGARWLYGVNSMFRPGLPRTNYGFADGGVTPHLGSGALPGPQEDTLKLLEAILAALGGVGSNPSVAASTAATSAALQALQTAGGLEPTATEKRIADELAAGKVDLRFPHEKRADEVAIANERRDQIASAVKSAMSSTGTAAGPVSADAAGIIQYAQAASGGKYDWGASDLASGLSDCSGAISDLVEILTKGQADAGRLFSTYDAGQVLKSLGAVEGAVPGALQIGWSQEHMRATLPNGVPFESGGGTGQGATYGGNAKGAAGMPNIMSLPVKGGAALIGAGGLSAGTAAALNGGAPGVAAGGADVCACIAQALGAAGLTSTPGQENPAMQQLVSSLTGAAGGVTQDVAEKVLQSALGVGNRPLPENEAKARKLLAEGNPLGVAALLGYKVGDYGKTPTANLDAAETGQGVNAQGQIYTDTAALIDRTFTSMWQQMKAQFDQIKDVLAQVRDQLVQISSQLAAAAAQSGTSAAAGAAGAAFAAGGGVYGGTPGVDSVPALLMPGEHVFTRSEVAKMGGQAGVYRFRKALNSGQIAKFATGGGVVVNDRVGAEWFGVSQIPILSTIVNALISVLLRVLGVQIEARDTLNEMTGEFRQFRGDFQSFDATGRLYGDTSALSERSSTSEEEAAAERIRILKIVIQALIQFIIEKVIVPLGKAIGNALLSAAGSAASSAITGSSFGMGGQIAGSAVSSLITGVGGAGIDIIADIGSNIGIAVADVLVDILGDALGDVFPDLFASGLNPLADILSGSLVDPLLGAFGGLTRAITGLVSPIGGLFGGLFGGAAFDSGGLARGAGMMPKATIEPERVLSPRQTELFDRMVAALENGNGGGRGVVIDGLTVEGPKAERFRENLLELIN